MSTVRNVVSARRALLRISYDDGESILGSSPGVFCLQPSAQGTGSDPYVYSDPDVDGISVRQKWGDLEPAEGVYNWTYLDNVTARAAAAGKAVLLRIGTGGGDIALGGSCPAWVTDAVAAEPLPASQNFTPLMTTEGP